MASQIREAFRLAHHGRFLTVELLTPHLTISTSARNGGQRNGIRYIVNHQSCEASDHRERHSIIAGSGQESYHDEVCRELALDAGSTVTMGTAANMNYAAIVDRADRDVTVTAIVTAGVQGNAACAGDPALWRETETGWEKYVPGTINTILLIGPPVTDGALARAVVTMTEAKTAALQRLAVRSLYSTEPATGTGTDQYAVASPLGPGKPLTSTGPHAVLGELIGAAVRDATLEALRWQNGLEPSYTRGIFHALGRYGLTEATFFERIAPHMDERGAELLRRNSKAVFYEPLAAAAAFAIAAVLDRARHGTLPAGAAATAIRQQAASMAASIAAKPAQWAEFYEALPEGDPEHAAELVLAAIARGWSAKWT